MILGISVPVRRLVALGFLLLFPSSLPGAEAPSSPHRLPGPSAEAAIRPAGATAAEVAAHAATLRARRQASAIPLVSWLPSYRIGRDASTTLYLLNTTADPLLAELQIVAHDGNRSPLGSFWVSGLRHEAISLDLLLDQHPPHFFTGAAELSFLGDAQALQAWAVIEEKGQVVEIPFQLVDSSAPRVLTGFWAVGPRVGQLPQSSIRARTRARLALINGGRFPSTVSVTVSPDPGEPGRQLPATTRRLDLAPGQTASLVLPAVGGRVVLEHDGDPGAIAAVGLLEDPRSGAILARFPLAEPDRLLMEPPFFSMPVTGLTKTNGGHGTPTVRLALHSVATETRVVSIRAMGEEGRTVWQRRIELTPGATGLLDVGPDSSRSLEGARFEIDSDGPGLLIDGTIQTRHGELLEIPFFSTDELHGGGTYPLPAPARHRVVTTLINPGHEPAEVVFQLAWDGGTHALGPLLVEPGHTRVLDWDEITRRREPDLLGRTIDAGRPNAALKWTVHRGSRQLLGRTDVIPRTGTDRFGFNCFGCCWQFPYGEILPSLVEFAVGQTPSFQACVSYDTCSGVMGPYWTPTVQRTVPFPFSWNGSTISASQAADGDLSFEGVDEAIKVNCTVEERSFFGFGRAEACQETFNPKDYDPKKTCTVQTAHCLDCLACCEDLFQEKQCRGKDPRLNLSERNLCIGNCNLDMNCD